jgi:tetratricopeptide (TPR) repeat protein
MLKRTRAQSPSPGPSTADASEAKRARHDASPAARSADDPSASRPAAEDPPSEASASVPTSGEWVDVHVGGVHHRTRKATLAADPDSMLASAIEAPFLHNSRIDIDRDGTHFRHVLTYLRDMRLPKGLSPEVVLALATEAKFYGLDALRAEAKHIYGARDAKRQARGRPDELLAYVQYAMQVVAHGNAAEAQRVWLKLAAALRSATKEQLASIDHLQPTISEPWRRLLKASAEVYLASNELLDAIEKDCADLPRDPPSALRMWAVSRLLEEVGFNTQALAAAAVEAAPTDLTYRLHQVACARASDLSAAHALLEPLLQGHGDVRAVLLEAARISIDQRAWSQATVYLDRADFAGQDPDAAAERAQMALFRGQASEAISLILAGLNNAPKNHHLQLLLGVALHAVGEHVAARDALLALYRQKTFMYEVRCMLVWVSISTGEAENAYLYFFQASDIGDGMVEHYTHHDELPWEDLGDDALLRSSLEDTARHTNYGLGFVSHRLASELAGTDDHSLRMLYEELSRRYPDDVQAHIRAGMFNLYGDAASQPAAGTQAALYFRRALKLEPHHVMALAGLARSLVAAAPDAVPSHARRAEAIELYGRAIDGLHARQLGWDDSGSPNPARDGEPQHTIRALTQELVIEKIFAGDGAGARAMAEEIYKNPAGGAVVGIAYDLGKFRRWMDEVNDPQRIAEASRLLLIFPVARDRHSDVTQMIGIHLHAQQQMDPTITDEMVATRAAHLLGNRRWL